MTSATLRPGLRAAAWAAALATLALVFAAYLQPSMARQVADLVWSCL